jgi:hypothetical protein
MANETQLSPQRAERIKLNTLAAFGIAVLQLMENESEWSGDTMDQIQLKAVAFDLCYLDPKNGMFKSKL